MDEGAWSTNCDCPGNLGTKDWTTHKETCPSWMQGRIAQLEQELANEKHARASAESLLRVYEDSCGSAPPEPKAEQIDAGVQLLDGAITVDVDHDGVRSLVRQIQEVVLSKGG